MSDRRKASMKGKKPGDSVPIRIGDRETFNRERGKLSSPQFAGVLLRLWRKTPEEQREAVLNEELFADTATS